MKRGSMGFFSSFFLTCLLLTLFSSSLAKAAVSKTNTTSYDETIGGLIEDQEEEELLFLEQRVLVSGPNYISYKGLERPPVCNANIYGNCIKPIGKNYRPCTVYTRCKRGVK
ncbi:protein RALF-like 27 [Hibiscus syriacus]|uniref:protein RALF-like 27 n=1 Tax=Hibiscus syriacus TaxID=106335 RepID=UPI001922DF42|nr:protein RALF-like 27 [Hibiscus syriacus]